MIFVLDNYDSFTYNLVQLLGQITEQPIVVRRNDKVTLAEVEEMQPSHIVISPGPGRPEAAGISVELLQRSREKGVPVLGVCLGHQALGAACGAVVSRAPRLVHGKTSKVYHDGSPLFQGLSNPFEATRYHSLVVEEETLTPDLVVSAWTSDGEIMGLRHRTLPLVGVQFHPESILTREGRHLCENFLVMGKVSV